MHYIYYFFFIVVFNDNIIDDSKDIDENNKEIGKDLEENVNTVEEVSEVVKELITIYHKPDTPAGKTMDVPEDALEGHLGHGDYLGWCEE